MYTCNTVKDRINFGMNSISQQYNCKRDALSFQICMHLNVFKL